MVTASKATVPTISDQASAMQLSQCAKNLASALAELRTASQKVRPRSLQIQELNQNNCTSHQDDKKNTSSGKCEHVPLIEWLFFYFRDLQSTGDHIFTRCNALYNSFLSQAQEACGPLEIENALSMVRGLEKDMQEAKASAEAGKLKPLPGETVRHAE